MNKENRVQTARAGTFKGVFLLRDSSGNVKYDDPHNVPQQIIDALTPADLEHLDKLKLET